MYILKSGMDLSVDEIKKSGFDKYFVDHTLGIYPQSAAGVPFTAAYFQSRGDPITDLTENMAAEQKARSTYYNIHFYACNPAFNRNCGRGPRM